MTQEFGRALKAQRKGKGLSLAELARRAHTSASHLGNVERGAREPSEMMVADLDIALESQGRLRLAFRQPFATASTQQDLVDALHFTQLRLVQLGEATDQLHRAIRSLSERIISTSPTSFTALEDVITSAEPDECATPEQSARAGQI